MLRHATRLLHGLLAVGLLLGLAPSARAAATYDVTQVGDVGFSQVWNATGNKEVKSGDTIGFNPWSVHITLEGHIDDISALAAGDVVSVPLTSDAGSHFSMNGTGWECADDVATSDGTVAFKANMRDGRADLRLTRTAARLSGRFDFRVVIRNGNLWYADRKSTSSTWHAGSDTFAFHNTTKPNHRCVNDTTGVGVNSTKSGVGASMVTWNCATVNRIARGGAESDTAPDVTYHIHVASADEGHPVTVASGTRAFEAYHAYDGTTAGDAFTGPGGGSHVAYTPKRTDGTPTAGDPGTTAKAAANGFTRTGHTFTGWNTRRDGTGTACQASDDVAYPAEGRTLTLYAQWRPITYTIRFGGNGATSGMMADLTVAYDGKKTLPANRYARPGKAFAGWNTKTDGSGAMYRNKAEVTNLASSQDDVVVLYAQWEDAMTAMPETGGTVGDRRFGKTIGGGLVFWPSSRPCWRDGACAETGSINRKGGVTC